MRQKSLLPILAFWVLGLVWGSNFIFMKISAAYITPMQLVFYRVLFGFIPVLIYALATRALSVVHIKHTFHFIIMSFLASVIYYYGFAKGTALLPSGIAGVMAGTIPIFSFILASIFLSDEKISLSKIIGISLGLIGIILISKPSGSNLNGINLAGIGYIILGCFSVGASFVYAKKFIQPLQIPAAALTTYQLLGGLIILIFVTPVEGMGNIWSSTSASLGIVIGLGILGTGLAYILYYYIIEKLGAIAASSSTYIPPIIALAIGYIFAGEVITIVDIFATGLIFAGVILLRR